MNRPNPVHSAIKPEQLKSWLPIDALIRDGRPAIEWMDLRDVDFSEPFFSETLARVNANGLRQRLVTEFDFLVQLATSFDSLEPSGFIFHASRCGSTLLTNACRALKGSVVMSEAPILDKIISRFFTDAEPNSTKELLYMVFLRAAVNALGQRRRGDERHYFIKFACTSTLQMSRIRRIWPKLPFVFLYRNPIEIVASNLRSIPEWMQPESNPKAAAAIVGVEVSELTSIAPEEFCARALGRFFHEADANRELYTNLLNYDQLTSDMLIETLAFFGTSPSAEEMDEIREVARLYSKDPSRSQIFRADGEAKRASASASLIEMVEQWALPSYERLNVRR
jgi:hypothetical protein